jgi:hypothetical protein
MAGIWLSRYGRVSEWEQDGVMRGSNICCNDCSVFVEMPASVRSSHAPVSKLIPWRKITTETSRPDDVIISATIETIDTVFADLRQDPREGQVKAKYLV